MVINPKHLSCSWITQLPKQKTFVLKVHKTFSLHNLQITPTTLANPHYIATCIKQFLKAYNLHDACVTIALTAPHITQQFVTLPHASPDPQEFNATNSKQALWDYHYLYPTDNNKHVFYTCSISQPLLLQYKLLATQAHINLVTITSQNNALLNVYRYFYGPAFRASQLAVDMIKYDNNIELFFNSEAVKRIISIPPSIHQSSNNTQENLAILTSCGLFISERTL